MRSETGYGGTAKLLHWLTVLLLVIQYAIGWLMPEIRRGMQPGSMMNLHMSFGMLVLAVIVLRYAWRLVVGTPAQPQLPDWQRRSSEAVHVVLYLLVLVVTLTGWFYASMRGWSITAFGVLPVPALVAVDSPIGRSIGRLHETLVWGLLVVVGLHVAAALLHEFVFRDGVMKRMWPRLGTAR